ncbi:MAG: hypothetical protein L0H93_07830 [Nocardioides sp.]|nr:hypothetical protein [Nocardioides sp.]
MVLDRFEPAHIFRPVRLVAAGQVGSDAACAAVEVSLAGPITRTGTRVRCGFTAAGVRLEGWYDGKHTGIEITTADETPNDLRSRRHGKVTGEVTAIAATLTGRQFTFLTRGPAEESGSGGSGPGRSGPDAGGVWTARAKVHLDDPVDVSDLTVVHIWDGEDDTSPLDKVTSGPFGQLGLRDLHLVTHADGTPYVRDDLVFLTATHAGPGFFDTAHCGVWSFDRESFAMEHRGDLWFQREGRDGLAVYGDHATHIVRHEERWLVATSTWGDFEKKSIGITLAETDADLLTGDHVLDSAPLSLRTDRGLPQPVVGVWDPHLTLIDGHWHVAFVAARRFFNFYPVLARACEPGALDGFEVVGAATSRKATEGTIIARLEGEWRVVASDGRENRPENRAEYPVFDLAMEQVGALDAPYSSNLPWPSLIPHGDQWLLVTFDGKPYGGPLTGYGTHGDVVVMATEPTPEA